MCALELQLAMADTKLRSAAIWIVKQQQHSTSCSTLLQQPTHLAQTLPSRSMAQRAPVQLSAKRSTRCGSLNIVGMHAALVVLAWCHAWHGMACQQLVDAFSDPARLAADAADARNEQGLVLAADGQQCRRVNITAGMGNAASTGWRQPCINSPLPGPTQLTHIWGRGPCGCSCCTKSDRVKGRGRSDACITPQLPTAEGALRCLHRPPL